jgi:hypothetical protein
MQEVLTRFRGETQFAMRAREGRAGNPKPEIRKKSEPEIRKENSAESAK